MELCVPRGGAGLWARGAWMCSLGPRSHSPWPREAAPPLAEQPRFEAVGTLARVHTRVVFHDKGRCPLLEDREGETRRV